jgi:hypothetical protein
MGSIQLKNQKKLLSMQKNKNQKTGCADTSSKKN